MLSFAIRTANDPQQLTSCNLHHVQLMLSFIGVKHAHIQEILGNFFYIHNYILYIYIYIEEKEKKVTKKKASQYRLY